MELAALQHAEPTPNPLVAIRPIPHVSFPSPSGRFVLTRIFNRAPSFWPLQKDIRIYMDTLQALQ